MCPDFKEAEETASQFVNAVRNSAVLLGSLLKVQLAAGGQPLRLVKSGNTRKWSGCCLVIQRLLRLRPFIDTLPGAPPTKWELWGQVVPTLQQIKQAEDMVQGDGENLFAVTVAWCLGLVLVIFNVFTFFQMPSGAFSS